MNSKLLRYYFEKDLYFQNPPMIMKKFIDFCKKRGVKIDQSKLEELEKNKLFYPIFRVTEIYNPIYGQFVAPSFGERGHDDLLDYFNKGSIYIPQDKEFIEFKNFYDTETQSLKTYSYYSAFQIWPLIKILDDEKVVEHVDSRFENFVNLLIAIQLYAPYGRSNLRRINLKTERDNFYQRLEEFDLDEILNIINLGADELYKAYAMICSKLRELLGSDDIIQLWKNISWPKKDKCIGHTRLGIEYLQWAMMLKRCIEDYLGHETFDVDEVDDWKKVRDELPSQESGRTLRGVRNDWFKNKLTDEYEFRLNRKKLYYLANSLTLDYHPRVIVFVEGETEEIIIPKFFGLYGFNFRDLGFEIVNVEGITKYYSGNIGYQKNDEKIDKVLINNFRNLITFNLNLWQAVPFFIGDDE
ncbi:TOPRIM nucleotidyl transferase/hydrolase domain-containing protein, partial [uncultured Methanobrevibacter sp.]|uniref:TOPRIM nucleotidyl transferase/hydrolase domain-containing protein n=1 Tax=uncultured Methanobrevibacter sp. TaxID=253161 RepID=UPI002623AE72